MDSSYEVVSYQPEFKQQVLELQTELWSPSLVQNRAYFEWKHERNPYVSTPLAYLALHRGTVVAMRSFFGVRWEAGSPQQQVTCLYADDLVVGRDHRGRGLIHRIMTAGLEDVERLGYEYVFNLSAGLVTFVSSLSMGWRSAGYMDPRCRRSWRLACRAGLSRVARKLPGLSWSGGRLPTVKSRKSLAEVDPGQVARNLEGGPSISFALAPRVDAMSALVRRVGSDGRIRHVRDRTYFEWRFKNPFRRYAFLYCDEAGLEGYLVLQERTAAGDPTPLNLVDWEATSPEVFDRLLAAASRVAGHDGQLFIWSATLPQAHLALLARNGFRAVRPEPGPGRHLPALLVRALANDRPASEWLHAGRRLLDLADWDLRMLDSMHG